MNIVETHKSEKGLEAKVVGSFNLAAKNRLESRLSSEITELKLDLSECRFIDTEGVIFMYNWQQSGKKITLSNPPEILFEIIDFLELTEHWDLNYIEK
jgi:ABC-type transporter Mla MlaB component